MNLNLWAAVVIISLILGGGTAWWIYDKGYHSGKEGAAIEQEKFSKKVKGNDVKIDKKTPFNSERAAQLKWLFGYTVRQ